MRLAVVSDTHGHLPFARRAIHMLHALEVAEVIHCGDIDTPETVELFAPWPTHFVFGNVDLDREALGRAIAAQARFTLHGDFGELKRQGCHIAFLHGHDTRRLQGAISGGHYDLVCHGHTHQARLERQNGTWVLNPGALYRAVRHTLAIVDLPALQIETIEVP